MHNDQSLTAIVFEPNGFGQCPARLERSIAAAHLEMVKALWMLSALLNRAAIDSTPVTIPEDQVGTFNLADPMLARGFNRWRCHLHGAIGSSPN
jgi:hypothetical protein